METNQNFEITIEYREEKYKVKKDGTIYRFSRTGKRKRKDDEIWTSGTNVDDKGFYVIGGHTVHSIVATAFLGEQPNSQYVVLHKNYSKKDNRIENLLWVTKSQFHLLQPKTQAQLRIVSSKKKFEEVLEDFENVKSVLPMNLQWMSKLSKEDIDSTIKLYKDLKFDVKKEYKDIKSLTQNAVQRNNWWVKSDFPCCPKDNVKNTIETYFDNLAKDKVFCHNDYYESLVSNYSFNQDKTAIIIKVTDGEKESVKPWKLAEVTMENGIYIHKNLGTYFEENGSDKYFDIAIGKEWSGGEVFDDFC